KKIRLALRRKGKFLYTMDRLADALPPFEALLTMYDPEKDQKYISNTLRKLAYAYRKTGDIETSMAYYQKSIDNGIAAGEEGRFNLASAYNGRGSAFLNLEEYDLAEADYLHALELFEALNNPKLIAIVYNNLALIYTRTERYDLAIHYLEKSLEIKKEFNDPQKIANTLANLGDVAFHQGKYAESKAYHLQSIQIRDSLNLPEDVTQSYTRMGEIALINSLPKAAIEWCSKSCAIADAGQFWEAQKECHNCLHQAYAALQEWEKALMELQLSKSIQDSIEQQNQAAAFRLQSLKKKYEASLAQAELEKEQLANDGKFSKWILFAAVLILGVASLALRRYYKSKEIVSLKEALLLLSVPKSRPSLSSKPSAEVVDWLAQFREHVEKMIEDQQQITISSLAASHHLSERQLLRRIKEETDFTTSQYVREIRLLLTKRWIEEKRYDKVKEVARAAGFKSYAHFSDLFTKRFGQSPKHFLR
ncbi:MAG: AraC family transcriptional regulator, partial [Bacteroidota bacterium]